MKFRIIGAERQTGDEVDKVIEAPTVGAAEELANRRMNVLVQRVEPVRSSETDTPATKQNTLALQKELAAAVAQVAQPAVAPPRQPHRRRTLGVCRACGKAVSKAAKICPHCGQPNPAKISRAAFVGSFVFAIIAFGLLADVLFEGGDSGANSAANMQSSDSAIAVSSPASLAHLLEQVLSPSNRDVPRVGRVESTPGPHGPKIVSVTWTINDNLSKRFIFGGAIRDVVKILRGVHDSTIDYAEVRVSGTFPLEDALGNTDVHEVIRGSFTRATIDQINWDRFLPENIPRIADLWYVHPALQ